MWLLSEMGKLIDNPAFSEGNVNRIDLNHRHAVVTGGAQGARLLRRSAPARVRGVSFALGSRYALKFAFDQLQGLGIVSIEMVDVSHAENVMAAIDNTIRKHDRIDILVASASIGGPNFKSWEYPLDAWRQIIDINLTGVFLCCRAIVPHMIRQNYGRIVNISSIAGKEGNATASAYSAAKAGVIAFTKSLGKETALNNIAVNCITPAAAKTRIFDQVTPEQHRIHALENSPWPLPQGRRSEFYGSWLVSEENSFTTAAVFDLSGGRATY